MDKRVELIRIAQELNVRGLSKGRSGNVSVRESGGLLITPSAIPFSDVTSEDIVFVSLDGTSQGKRKPSSEWQFHLEIMKSRLDVEAIVHCHSEYATVISCRRESLSMHMHYMVLALGGDVRCTPFEIPGSTELARAVIRSLNGRFATLLGNHGQIAVGETLEQALERAELVEEMSKLHFMLEHERGLVPIPKGKIPGLRKIFRTYGKDK